MQDGTPKVAPAASPARPFLESKAWVRAGISRSYAHALIAEGNFPRPVKVGRASRFLSTEIDAWIAARVARRDAVGARD